MTLEDLGWTPHWSELFEPYRSRGSTPARVSLEHTHVYRVLSPEGERLARVSGRLRHATAARAEFPAVGDWVAIGARAASLNPGDAGPITGVLPRSSRFSRRAAGNPAEEQVVAANVDVVFLVSALDRDFNPRRIERYLVTAWDSGAAPVIVLNKADLVDDPAPFVSQVEALAHGVPVMVVSVKRPASLDGLNERIGAGRTAAVLGSSGVGKSSIANVLIGEERLATRDVRARDSRGRHTSTARQLVLLPGGGILIDTPGMRELQLWETGGALAGVFSDIESLAPACRFRDCRHRLEPGCAVTAAVEDGRLATERLDSFRRLQDEQLFQMEQQDVRARLEAKRQARVASKALEKRLREKR